MYIYIYIYIRYPKDICMICIPDQETRKKLKSMYWLKLKFPKMTILIERPQMLILPKFLDMFKKVAYLKDSTHTIYCRATAAISNK